MLRHFYQKYKGFRKFFWNRRAAGIDKKWGREDGDFETIKKVIIETGAQNILDIGCGSGRLFPLYQSLGIENVTGQDISSKALRLAGERNVDNRYLLLCCEIMDLNFSEKYFDLIISNRCLSAVSPGDISMVIGNLCTLSNFIYLNEFTIADNATGSFYWYMHDYKNIFEKNRFQLHQSGTVGEQNQDWFLFRRDDGT